MRKAASARQPVRPHVTHTPINQSTHPTHPTHPNCTPTPPTPPNNHHQPPGEGEFGVVYKARWHGSLVAVKVLKDMNAMALGDFRTELNVLQKARGAGGRGGGVGGREGGRLWWLFLGGTRRGCLRSEECLRAVCGALASARRLP